MEKFLQTCTDYEIAVLLYFKKDAYMQSTTEKLKLELSRRGISEEAAFNRVKETIQQPSRDDNHGCNKCYGNKTVTEEVPFYKTSKGLGLDGLLGKNHKQKVRRCLLCDYRERIRHRNPFMTLLESIFPFLKRNLITVAILTSLLLGEVTYANVSEPREDNIYCPRSIPEPVIDKVVFLETLF